MEFVEVVDLVEMEPPHNNNDDDDNSNDEPKSQIGRKVEEVQSAMNSVKFRLYNLVQEDQVSKQMLQDVECGQQKAVEEVHSLQRQNGLLESKHKDELQKLEDKLMSVTLECEDRLKAQNRDRERYMLQNKLSKKEADSAREQLRSKVVEIMKADKKMNEFQKELQASMCKTKAAEGQVEKFKLQLEHLASEHHRLASNLALLEDTVSKVMRVSYDLQAAIMEKTQMNEKLTQECQALKLANNHLSVEAMMASSSRSKTKLPPCSRCSDARKDISKMHEEEVQQMQAIEASLRRQLQQADETIDALRHRSTFDQEITDNISVVEEVATDPLAADED